MRFVHIIIIMRIWTTERRVKLFPNFTGHQQMITHININWSEQDNCFKLLWTAEVTEVVHQKLNS